MTALLPLPLGTNSSEALAVNESGIAVGYALNSATGPLKACRWMRGSVERLTLPIGPESVANDINVWGDIGGWMGVAVLPGWTATPYIWRNGKTEALWIPTDAGEVTALNSRGDACGIYVNHNRVGEPWFRRGCAWIDGQFVDLGMPAGAFELLALDINNAREIVGFYMFMQGTQTASKPFIWRDGVMSDLTTMVAPDSPRMIDARAINDKGQIAGEAIPIGEGYGVAFRLTPALPETPGDSNCDGQVNTDDLINVVGGWNPQGPVGGGAIADLNRDNRIDALDLFEVIEHWTGSSR